MTGLTMGSVHNYMHLVGKLVIVDSEGYIKPSRWSSISNC